jgi:hypothetical protein
VRPARFREIADESLADEQAGAGLSREQAIAYALGRPSETLQLQADRAALIPALTSGPTIAGDNRLLGEAPGVPSAYLRR